MDQSPLSPRDSWVIARLLAGYTFKELPTSMSARGEQLCRQLMVVNVKDREMLLKRNVGAEEHRAIMLIDTESAIPAGGDPSKSYTILHAKELKNLPAVNWLLPGMIMEAGLTILYGESGAGKSFIGIDYALTVAQNRRVVYVPTEGEGGYRKRVQAWCDHHQKTEGDLYFILGSISLFDKDRFAELFADLRKLKPAMVVFDTLAMAMAGGDENSSRDMGHVVASCRKINHSTRAAVVLVHHIGKSGPTARGSSALPGNADVMIKVSPADDLVLVECTKTKDEAPFDSFYVFMRPIGESLVPVPSEQYVRSEGSLTPNQRKVLDVMALEVNREGVSLRDLSEFTGVSLGSVQRTLSNLLNKKLVHKPSGSYAINSAGLEAIGKSESPRSKNGSPSDPDRSKNAQPMNQGDPRSKPIFEAGESGSADSLDSVGSSAKRAGSRQKAGSPDHWRH